MTDKEFKRLSRSQLIEIIYQLQLKEEALMAENQRLQMELANRRIRIERIGNIAEAAMDINNVMQAAQSAAEQYLDEIHQLRTEAEGTCQKILEEARLEAAEIVARARQQVFNDPAIEAILEEFRQDRR